MNDSQQRQRGQAAPYNPNPRWPARYFQGLEELGVEERRRAFYAHWVRQFFNRNKGRKRRRDQGRVEVEAFLQDLADESGVADWQVVQARGALEVYYEQFRGIALKPEKTVAARQKEDLSGKPPRREESGNTPRGDRIRSGRPILFQFLVCLTNRRPSLSRRDEGLPRKWTGTRWRKQAV